MRKSGAALRAGCHLSVAGGLTKMGEKAVQIGATTFQFFSGNPRGGTSKAWDPEDLAGLRTILEEHDISRLVAHAPYILNPASEDPDKRAYALSHMQADLDRLRLLPGTCYNFHPGCHRGQGQETGMREIADLLCALEIGEENAVLLETMAGKGTEVGSTFEELAGILEMAGREQIGVCLDTCHVWDAGYDIRDHLEAVLEDFDRHIGLRRLRAVHLNDSQSPRGSRRDRHARIGEGQIGEEALYRVCTHPVLRELPIILETPNDLDGYAREIRWMREGVFR